MDIILEYNWELFIFIEIFSLISLILFGVFRYFFNNARLSFMFIFLFLLLLVTEGALGIYVYRQTGEISTFQIVITVFIIYAFTFGIVDFIRLDRWMRKWVGKLRNTNLLTEKDYRVIERNKDPKFLAKKYRLTSLIHLGIFLIGQSIFWALGTDDITEAKEYLINLSWLEENNATDSPYPNETVYGIGVIWGIAFIADFIYSWSYTLFPGK